MNATLLRKLTGGTLMAAVASAMLLAVGEDSGTPARFELSVDEGAVEAAPPTSAGPVPPGQLPDAGAAASRTPATR